MISSNTFSNAQIATIAVAQLGGKEQSVDGEDVAIAVNRIAPGRFSWRKYPQYIDLAAVYDALNDAKKQRNGELILGSRKDGWMLSAAGISWIRKQKLVKGDIVQPSRTRRNASSENLAVEQTRMQMTQAYHLFHENRKEEISKEDYFQFAKINEYFKEKAKERRYAVIESAVSTNAELNAVWQFLKQKFE